MNGLGTLLSTSSTLLAFFHCLCGLQNTRLCAYKKSWGQIVCFFKLRMQKGKNAHIQYRYNMRITFTCEPNSKKPIFINYRLCAKHLFFCLHYWFATTTTYIYNILLNGVSEIARLEKTRLFFFFFKIFTGTSSHKLS